MTEQRDWLDFIDILVVPLVVLVLGLLWPTIGRFWRRRRFSWLVLRELAELSPYPETKGAHRDWPEHMKKRFLHRDLLDEPEVALSVSPSLAYHLTQLWDALKQTNDTEWHYHLCELRRLFRHSLLPARRHLLHELDVARWQWGLLHEDLGLGEAEDRKELGDISKAIRRANQHSDSHH